MGAAGEVNIFDHIAAFVDAGQRRAKPEIHVGEKTVLGVTRPDTDRARITRFNFDVNIGECGIKGSGIGVRNGTSFRLRIARSPAGKKNHDLFVRRIAEAGRACRQGNDRPFGTVADQPDAGPDIKRVPDAISSRCKQNYALAGGCLNLIHRLLQSDGVVITAGGGDKNRLGILQSLGVKRRGPAGRHRKETQ